MTATCSLIHPLLLSATINQHTLHCHCHFKDYNYLRSPCSTFFTSHSTATTCTRQTHKVEHPPVYTPAVGVILESLWGGRKIGAAWCCIQPSAATAARAHCCTTVAAACCAAFNQAMRSLWFCRTWRHTGMSSAACTAAQNTKHNSHRAISRCGRKHCQRDILQTLPGATGASRAVLVLGNTPATLLSLHLHGKQGAGGMQGRNDTTCRTLLHRRVQLY